MQKNKLSNKNVGEGSHSAFVAKNPPLTKEENKKE